MFKKTAEVVEVNGRRVTVRAVRDPLCSCCSMRFLCVSGEETSAVENNSGEELKEGDRIEVGVDEGKNIMAGVLTFLLPAVIFICTLFLTEKLGAGRSLLAGLLAVVVYYFLANRILRGAGSCPGFIITRKV